MTDAIRERARQLWESISDDDACVIGYPEGLEYLDEPIIARITAAMTEVAATAYSELRQRVLAATQYPKECVHDEEPDYCDCCKHEWEKRIAKLRSELWAELEAATKKEPTKA